MNENLRTFFRTVNTCRQCYGDRCGISVHVPERIPERVRVIVIGEQPPRPDGEGANGATEETDYLRGYLERAGVDADSVLHVTAVLCHPDRAAERPGRPSATEMRNCSSHLRQLIARADPQLIVPVGHSGLLALQFAMKEWTELRQFILNYDVGTVLKGPKCSVYPLYLPSPTTLKARPEERQVRDWQRIPQLLQGILNPARTT